MPNCYYECICLRMLYSAYSVLCSIKCQQTELYHNEMIAFLIKIFTVSVIIFAFTAQNSDLFYVVFATIRKNIHFFNHPPAVPILRSNCAIMYTSLSPLYKNLIILTISFHLIYFPLVVVTMPRLSSLK